MKKLIAIISILIIFGFQPSLLAETQDTLKVLFIGNSFTYSNNLPQLVNILSKESDTYISTQKSTAPGAKLSQHWLGQRGLSSKALIETGDFDIVILQEHSMGSIDFADSSEYYIKLFVEFCKIHGATPCIFQTWAYKNEPHMLDIISAFYLNIGKEVNARVLPIGELWQNFQSMHDDIDLYDEDGIHPSKHGTFLAALSIIKGLSQQIPESIPSSFITKDSQGEDVYLMYIDAHKISIFKDLVNSY